MKRWRSRDSWRSLTAIFLPLLASISLGCSATDDSNKSTTTGEPPPPSARLSGLLLYEFVPYDQATEGLDYSKTDKKPIRGARVELRGAADDSVLKETVSDSQGHYAFDWEGAGNVKLWVYAETVEPAIVVEDNTSSNAVYVLESAEVVADKPGTALDVIATTGWTGSSYGKPRLAAPFSILDATFTAAGRFLAETTPAPVFPKLKVNWSVDNRPESGTPASGGIDTSHWDGTEIYLLGKEDIDTDEFDTHVLVHEWGHSFEQYITRSDSPGGAHGFGDVLDPRIAFSEGFCTALSAMILEPDSVYADSMGQGQSDGFWEDIEANDLSADAVPGWYSETSVQNIVYDVYDKAEEPYDAVGFGLQGIYEVMTNEMKATPAATTLFPFIAALKSKPGAPIADIDKLVLYHASGSNFGIDPVSDDWGTGETHTGNVSAAIPVYAPVKVGETLKFSLLGGADPSLLAQNKFLRIKGDGAPITIQSTSNSDVDLYVYLRGKELDSATTQSGNESVSFTAKSGEEYVVNVSGYGEVSGLYDVTIEVLP